METGLQTAVVDTSMTSTCPDWCTRDHSIDEERLASDLRRAETEGVELDSDFLNFLREERESVGHDGPSFGLVEIGSAGAEQPTGDVENATDLTAAELRQLAADALAAAEWLESQR